MSLKASVVRLLDLLKAPQRHKLITIKELFVAQKKKIPLSSCYEKLNKKQTTIINKSQVTCVICANTTYIVTTQQMEIEDQRCEKGRRVEAGHKSGRTVCEDWQEVGQITLEARW